MKFEITAGPGGRGPDYIATTDDYDGAPMSESRVSPDPVGFGNTEAEARAHLVEQLGERAEEEALDNGWAFFVCPDADGELNVWTAKEMRQPKAVATYHPKHGIRFERRFYPSPADLRAICDAIDRWEDR